MDKYREIKVQTSIKRIVNTQYATAQGGRGVINTMFMGTGSPSMRRCQEADIHILFYNEKVQTFRCARKKTEKRGGGT